MDNRTIMREILRNMKIDESEMFNSGNLTSDLIKTLLLLKILNKKNRSSSSYQQPQNLNYQQHYQPNNYDYFYNQQVNNNISNEVKEYIYTQMSNFKNAYEQNMQYISQEFEELKRLIYELRRH